MIGLVLIQKKQQQQQQSYIDQVILAWIGLDTDAVIYAFCNIVVEYCDIVIAAIFNMYIK